MSKERYSLKGIVLAGGHGTRLYPATLGVSKQLLLVYDKPMIFYPISVLMLAGIRDILVITTPQDEDNFKRLLGNGDKFGLNISYKVQEEPRGIAQALIIGEDFIGEDNVCLILGDNIFYGQGFGNMLRKVALRDGATIFAYKVKDPKAFGVVQLDEKGHAIDLAEKPQNPKSSYAITGLYFYDNKAINIAKNITTSERGELEITAINEEYLNLGSLKVEILGRGFAWLDTGTPDSLLDAAHFVETIEKRQGFKIACLEEIGLENGWLEKSTMTEISSKILNSAYGRYLNGLLK